MHFESYFLNFPLLFKDTIYFRKNKKKEDFFPPFLSSTMISTSQIKTFNNL